MRRAPTARGGRLALRRPTPYLAAVVLLAATADGCEDQTLPVDVPPAAVEAHAPEPEPTAAPTTPAATARSSAPSPSPSESAESPSPAPGLPDGIPAEAQVAVVERVVDGDTIWVEPGGSGQLAVHAVHKVRLLQVDTPETVHPSEPVECFGPEASAYTSDQLLGQRVWLEADRENTDRYGRFLRYVWLDDATLFNEQLVADGYATAALYEPNDRHIDRIRAAEDQARASEAGMWAECSGPEATAPAASPSGPSASDGDCDPAYPDVCIPHGPPNGPDLNCPDVPHRNFTVRSPDPHGFDGDNDGVGCES